MSQRPTLKALLAAAAAALAVAGAGCGDGSGEAATPAGAEKGYPLEEICVYDPGGREICGQQGADWCKAYVAKRDKVRADENDVDPIEIGCEAYEG